MRTHINIKKKIRKIIWVTYYPTQPKSEINGFVQTDLIV